MARRVKGVGFLRGIAATYARKIRQAFTPLFGLAESRDLEQLLTFTIGSTSFVQGIIDAISGKHRMLLRTKLAREAGITVPTFVLDRNLDPWLVAKIQENVMLITGLSDETRGKLAALVARSLNDGTVDFRAELQRIGKFNANRARLIARDQTSKVQSQLHRLRTENMGVAEYRWRTSGDERVRKSHRDNNGKVFTWGEPPETGHPGEDIQCRCTAEIIIPDHILKAYK